MLIIWFFVYPQNFPFQVKMIFAVFNSSCVEHTSRKISHHALKDIPSCIIPLELFFPSPFIALLCFVLFLFALLYFDFFCFALFFISFPSLSRPFPSPPFPSLYFLSLSFFISFLACIFSYLYPPTHFNNMFNRQLQNLLVIF